MIRIQQSDENILQIIKSKVYGLRAAARCQTLLHMGGQDTVCVGMHVHFQVERVVPYLAWKSAHTQADDKMNRN